jgi:hypothetical protein
VNCPVAKSPSAVHFRRPEPEDRQRMDANRAPTLLGARPKQNSAPGPKTNSYGRKKAIKSQGWGKPSPIKQACLLVRQVSGRRRGREDEGLAASAAAAPEADPSRSEPLHGGLSTSVFTALERGISSLPASRSPEFVLILAITWRISGPERCNRSCEKQNRLPLGRCATRTAHT